MVLPFKSSKICFNFSLSYVLSEKPLTLPDKSRVSVLVPKTISNIYVLPYSIRYSVILVPFPTPNNKTPVASGSSVPACPIFLVFKIPLHIETTS